MSETKHTPLPWLIDRRVATRVVTNDGRSVCSTGGHYNNQVDPDLLAQENEANAEFIVLACKNHDRLVRALQAAERMLDCNEWSDPADIADQHEITAALAAAQEKP